MSVVGKMLGKTLPLALMGAAFLWSAGTASAASVQAAHRAVYDLALASANQGAGVDSVEGRLVFEVAGNACEGYTVNSRLVNRYSYREGNVRLIDLQNTSFEAGDAMSFDYQEKEYIDSRMNAEKRTTVKRSSTDAPADGELLSPTEKSFKLGADVLFPIQHQLQMVEAAKTGQTRFAANVFDGSDDEKAALVIATIGKRIDPANNKNKDDATTASLKDLSAWPVSLAYYALSGDQDLPTFQTSFQLYENGVSSNLVLDYGDMVLSGKLAKLEMLDSSSGCP